MSVFADANPEIWYRADSFLSMPKQDSISWSDQYTIYTVVRSENPDTTQCLWSFAENDTITSAVLTDGVYSTTAGVLRSSMPRDFSHWCIYSYHSGIHADSTKQRTLRFGEQVVISKDSSSWDTLSAQIQMAEFAYFGGAVSQLAASTFQTYLALKHGITLDYAAYLSSAGDTLWDPITDENYYHRIVGIGRDTVNNWTGNVSQTKEEVVFLLQTDSLQPNEYVLLGDNDGVLTWSLDAGNIYCLQRSWRLRTYLQQPQKVTLVLRLSALIESFDSLYLQVTDHNGMVQQTVLQDSIVGDSLCFFTLHDVDTISNLCLCSYIQATRPQKAPSKHNAQTPFSVANISVSDNTITIEGFPDDQLFDLYLYDSTGKLITIITSYNPITISNLPNTIFHVEICATGQIVGSITLPLLR